jgi:two-component system LytT family response regulator
MTRAVRVLVVDDEPLARSGVVRLLGGDPGIEVVGECGDGRSAVEAILSRKPDLVILDVQMPELDGFEVLRALEPEQRPEVIFVTAYDQHALRAFEVHAIDYLLKPFDDARFSEAIARARRNLERVELGELSRRLVGLLEDRAAPRAGEPPLTRLVVKRDGRVAFVRVDELDWIEAADYCVKLHTQGQVHLLRESLNALEARLDPAKFFRVHRSAIVNLDRIRELQPYFKGEHVLILQDGTRLKLSRARRDDLETRLGQSL